MNSADYGNQDKSEHDYNINAQAPQQHAHGKRKTPPTEVRSLLGRHHLIGFQKRQDNTWIFQIRCRPAFRNGFERSRLISDVVI
jgi:hypothetical protein